MWQAFNKKVTYEDVFQVKGPNHIVDDAALTTLFEPKGKNSDRLFQPIYFLFES